MPGDEYFGNLTEFERRSINDDQYFQEYLWREREIIPWDTNSYYQSGELGYSTKMEIEFIGTTNFKVGDKIKIYYVSNSTINTNGGYNTDMDGTDTFDGIQSNVLAVIPASSTQGQIIIIDVETTISQEY